LKNNSEFLQIFSRKSKTVKKTWTGEKTQIVDGRLLFFFNT